MRLFRLFLTILTAKFRSKLTLADTSLLSFRVWLTDVDVRIMNNATMLTVMEMGRLDYMVRTGFFALAMKRKWFYTAGAISIQFLRPLKAFQKAQLGTRVFHMDEQWIYLEHKITRKGKNIAVAIVKCTVKQGRKRVPYSRIVEELGLGKIPHEGREIIEAFEEENVLVKKRLLKNKADR